MIIIGFESSCDETGIAIVCTKHGLLGHILHSQTNLHKDYGGVVPELASRDHIQKITPLTKKLLNQCNMTLDDINLIAYTAGPGLISALLVGANFAQSLAWSRKLPILPIHHLEGHIFSPFLTKPNLLKFPFVTLLISGGHTQLIRVNKLGNYILLGTTVDDSVGETFDKTAQLIGLEYPGGPLLANISIHGDKNRFFFPRPMLNNSNLNFSFSGLKTAVLTKIHKLSKLNNNFDMQTRADLAAAIQDAIIDVLVYKSINALKKTGLQRLVVVGGVSANKLLRIRLTSALDSIKAYPIFPSEYFCTDNGAMIAFAAAQRFNAGLVSLNRKNINNFVKPRWSLAEINTI